MLRVIAAPTKVEAVGTPPKTILEFIGHVNSKTSGLSIAKMSSPPGWSEPGQVPEFDEFTVVLSGSLRVESREGGKEVAHDIAAGQAVISPAGEWVRYSSPSPEGAEYIAVCLPAFSPATVHRDA
jgi:mannose-6-phosphate isomerase-like protein (cupin superfamily)